MRAVAAFLCLMTLLPVSAGISLLEKDGDAYTGPTPPPPYAQLLADHGFNLGFPTTEMRSTGPLTPELVKQYNVVVVPNFATWLAQQPAEEAGRVLSDYLQSGGGVLLFQVSYLAGIPHFEALNAWLKQYGAAYQWEELEDDEHKYADPPRVPWHAPHRSDGGFDVVAHNPGEQAVTVNLQGEPGGPLEGFRQAVQLAPGGEQRLSGK